MKLLESISTTAEPAFKWLARAGGVLAGVATIAFFAGDHWQTWENVRTAETENRGIFAEQEASANLESRLLALEVALGRTDVTGGGTTTLVDELSSRVDTIAQSTSSNGSKIEELKVSTDSALASIGTSTETGWQLSGGANFTNGNTRYPLAQCPQGFYVAGVEGWGANASVRYCVGCFVGVRVLCKPLK